MNEIDIPLLNNERKILFSNSKSKLHNLTVYSPFTILNIKDNGFECNPDRAILLLSHGVVDKKSTILDCLNTFIDFLQAIQIPVKEMKEYQEVKECADFLTFNNNIDEMFRDKVIKINSVINFIKLGTDKIISNSIVLPLGIQQKTDRRKPTK
jgi:hypothetical protein